MTAACGVELFLACWSRPRLERAPRLTLAYRIRTGEERSAVLHAGDVVPA